MIQDGRNCLALGASEYTLIRCLIPDPSKDGGLEDNITFGYRERQLYVQQWRVLGFEDERIECENIGEHKVRNMNIGRNV